MKPMKPQKMWAVVDNKGSMIDIYSLRRNALSFKSYYNIELRGYFPHSVRRVLVTEIKKGKRK